MTPSDYEYLRKLLKERSGLDLSADKQYLVESRLLPLARKASLPGIPELVAKMKGGAEAATAEVVEAMTTNETFFFRDKIPFDHLRETVLPAMAKVRGAADALELVGLSKKMGNFPNELSGGEQQRVSIARALVNRPLILLADEPTGNLDPATSVGIMRLLDRINRTGTTVLMATHDRSIVDTMRRRVIELDRGAIVRDQSRGVYG